MSKINSSNKLSKKSLHNTVSAVSEWIASNVNNDELKKTFESKQTELQKLLAHTMKEKQKKVKDPNAPKKAKSGYILFCNEHREKVKQTKPNMSAKNIIQELGNMWQNASEEKKKHYNSLAEKDKERYKEEYHKYSPLEEKEKKAGPKRSLSAYIFFCKEKRPYLKNKNPNLSAKDLTSELGKLWMSLSNEQKTPYVKLSTQDKDRYQHEKDGSSGVNKFHNDVEIDDVEEDQDVEEVQKHTSRHKADSGKKEKKDKKDKKDKKNS